MNSSAYHCRWRRDDVDFNWVNDHRLLFSMTDLAIGKADVRVAPGLFAVNSDGSSMRQLVERNHYFASPAPATAAMPR